MTFIEELVLEDGLGLLSLPDMGAMKFAAVAGRWEETGIL